MQQQEQGLIDGLFDRLKQAQARDSKRDQQADQLIHPHLAQQHIQRWLGVKAEFLKA